MVRVERATREREMTFATLYTRYPYEQQKEVETEGKMKNIHVKPYIWGKDETG
jgi:hypothetical protein